MLKAAAGGVLGCVVGALAVIVARTLTFRLLPGGVSYADLAATLLGAVSVLLAILGLFIAVLAVLGFSQFRDLARKTAVKTAREHIDQRLNDEEIRARLESVATAFLATEFKSGRLRRLLEERVDRVIYAGPGAPEPDPNASIDDVD